MDTMTVTIALIIVSMTAAIAEMIALMPLPIADTTEPIVNIVECECECGWSSNRKVDKRKFDRG